MSETSTVRDRNSSLVLKDSPSVIGTEGVVDVVVGWDQHALIKSTQWSSTIHQS